MSRRPETIIRSKTSPRTCAALGNRSASSWATVDFPEAIIPVMRMTALGWFIVVSSVAVCKEADLSGARLADLHELGLAVPVFLVGADHDFTLLLCVR